MRITRRQLRQLIQEQIDDLDRPKRSLAPVRPYDMRRRLPSISSSPSLSLANAMLMDMLPDLEEYTKMSDEEKTALVATVAKELGSTTEEIEGRIEDLLKDMPK